MNVAGERRSPEGAVLPQWWPAAVVFALSLAVYGLTCARTVTLVDSGELIVACASLGVAHPPGFPVYTLVGYLFSLLPVGSVAFRLALMSGFFGAVTAALVALVVSEIVAMADRTSGFLGDSHRVRLAAAAAPFAAGLSFAFSRTLWSYATVAEVYTLNLSLLAGVVWLLLRWRRTGAAEPVPLLAGLLFGLGLGVHHVTIALALPALVLFVWRSAGWRAILGRRVLPAATGATVGLLSYLYLPVAASRTPTLNWGDPSSLQRLWWHVTARQYQVNLFAGSAAQVGENLRGFLALLVAELTPVGLVVAVAGVVWLWRRDRSVLWLAALVVLLGVAYGVNYDIAEDTEAYFLATFMVAAVAVGGAVTWLLETGATRRWPVPTAIGLALLLPAASLGLHFRVADRSGDRIARNLVEDALAGVAPRGLLLTLEWQLYSPWLYLHHLEGFRPDATVIDANLCRRSWYVGQYLPATYPKVMESCAAEAQAFLVKLHDWEQGRPHDPDELTRLFERFLNALVARGLPDGEAYLTVPMEPGVGLGVVWVPHGLTMRLFARPPNRVEPEPALHLEPLMRQPSYLPEVARTKVRPYYALMLANRGRFLTLTGDLVGARRELDRALALEPRSSNGFLILGDLEVASGRSDAARAAFQKALRLDPGNRSAVERLQAMGSGQAEAQGNRKPR